MASPNYFDLLLVCMQAERKPQDRVPDPIKAFQRTAIPLRGESISFRLREQTLVYVGRQEWWNNQSANHR